jgi:hypothetical protein
MEVHSFMERHAGIVLPDLASPARVHAMGGDYNCTGDSLAQLVCGDLGRYCKLGGEWDGLIGATKRPLKPNPSHLSNLARESAPNIAPHLQIDQSLKMPIRHFRPYAE